MPPRFQDPVTRFWRHVSKGDDCWLWTGSTIGRGYGSFIVRRGEMKGIYAHRFSYRLHRGAIPEGMFVCHKCDVPTCVNPDHLFLGSRTDNMRDASRKKRTAAGAKHGLNLHPESRVWGERQGRSKLIAGQVLEIREKYAAGGVTLKALGDEYGVSQSAIHLIVTGRNWAHL